MTLTPPPSPDGELDALALALWFAWRASRAKAPDDPVGYQADFLKGYAQRRADYREKDDN
jgi:hypothetical protein